MKKYDYVLLAFKSVADVIGRRVQEALEQWLLQLANQVTYEKVCFIWANFPMADIDEEDLKRKIEKIRQKNSLLRF